MICHSGLAAKSVERESKRDFMPLPGDPESINVDKDRLRLGGRSGLVVIKMPMHLLIIPE